MTNRHKYRAIPMALALCITLAACGTKTPTPTSTVEPVEINHALTAYYEAFNASLDVFAEAELSLVANASLKVKMEAAAPLITLKNLPNYDKLADRTTTHADGLLPTGQAATRDIDGDTVHYASSEVCALDAPGGFSQKGDVITTTGELNTKSNILHQEYKMERSGAVVMREVVDVARLPEGAWQVQYLRIYDAAHRQEKTAENFALCGQHDASQREVAFVEPTDLSMSFTDIAAKADMTAVEMAEKYAVIVLLQVQDGTAKLLSLQ